MDALRRMETGRAMRAVMCAFSAAFLVAAALAPDPKEILSGFGRLCVAPAQLTRDYFKPELGSVSGAMLNFFLVGSLLCALMFLPGAKVTGTTVLGYFLTLGFCSFGINPLNILPILLGTLVYSRIKRQPFGKNINYAMFSTGLAPLITQALFYYPSMGEAPRLTVHGALLALLLGFVIGCAMPALCAHSQAFHKGYNLFNAGPAAGFLCFLLYAVLYKTTGVPAPAIGVDLGVGNRAFVNAVCIALYGLCLIYGLCLNGGFRGYGRLFFDTAYKNDLTAKYPSGLNVINLGVYGLFIVLYYNLIGATFTGPTMGVIICMACTACVGGTPWNVFPIMIGYAIMGLLNRVGGTAFAVNAQGLVVGLCFASGLAPITGEYGILAGIVAGILHYCLVTGVPVIHGGFNLYNGGFTAGIVCFVYVPVLEHFFGSRPRPGQPQRS